MPIFDDAEMPKFDGDMLQCPSCGDTATHVDEALLTTRPEGEDRRVLTYRVTAHGQVTVPGSDPIVEPQRRHHFTLKGWCEVCGCAFALTFLQHKGGTFVSADVLGDRGELEPWQ